jgi:hypothetical protein
MSYAVNIELDCHSRPVSEHGVNSSGNPYLNYYIDPPVKPEDDRMRKY